MDVKQSSRRVFTLPWFLKESEPSELGNLTAMDYIEAVRMNWFRFARAPAVLRVDFGRCVQISRISRVVALLGEAHWQIGIVETHIRLLKNQLSLMEDDELPVASIDELVELCGCQSETTDT